MASKHPRIAVVRDPELDAALAKARAILGDVKPATLVHDLAIRGAEELASRLERQQEAVRELTEWARTRTGLDWDVLADVERLAWEEPDDVGDCHEWEHPEFAHMWEQGPDGEWRLRMAR